MHQRVRHLTKWKLQYVQRHQPTLLYTTLQKAFADEDWVLVFTPPYTPSFQPAELLWAHVKGYVAYKHRNDRTLNDVIELLRDAFQGPADAKYKKLDCRKLVAHCHREMLEYARSDPLLCFDDSVGSRHGVASIRLKNDDSAPQGLAQAQQQALADAAAEQSVLDMLAEENREPDCMEVE